MCGDARAIPLPNNTVQCAVTSPPYFGLRAYGGDQDSIWGGRPRCDHHWRAGKKVTQSPQRDHAPSGGFANTRGMETARRGTAFKASQGSFCEECSAWKGAFGLEPTTALYVEHTIEILRELRRVLKD